MLRMELTGLGTSGMDGHAYNVVVTGHGIIMIFFCYAYAYRQISINLAIRFFVGFVFLCYT